MRRSLAIIFVLLLGLLFGLPSAALAADEMKPEAKSRLERGVELYEKQDYEAAIAEFTAGYAIDPKPDFLYARAQAERLAGKCEAAVSDYEKFLESAPPPEREAAARANLSKCKEEIAAKTPEPQPEPPPQPIPKPQPQSPPQPTPKPQPEPESEPFYTDVLGDVLVGTGIVALGIGTYFYISSKNLESETRDEADSVSGATYGEHVDRTERAEKRRTISAIAGGVGLALVAGGVLRFVLHSRTPETPSSAWKRSYSPRVSGFAEKRAGGVVVEGSF